MIDNNIKRTKSSSIVADPILNSYSKNLFKNSLILCIIIFILLGTIRSYGLFGPSEARMLILLNFLLMWFLPFLFLSKEGRNQIGLKKPNKKIWLFYGLIIGLIYSFFVFLLGYMLFNDSINNWFVNIGSQYLPAESDDWGIDGKFSLFLMVTFPSIIFSPIGEEIFFRGMIHNSVKIKQNEKTAIIVNGLAFAGIHIVHHGIIRDNTGFYFLIIPGIIFFLLMLVFSWLCTLLRNKSDSLYPAIICHSAFNLMMNITLFIFILK